MDTYINTDGNTVEIYNEEDCLFDPRKDMTPFGTMVCFHNRYRLGDENHGIDHNDFSGWDEMQEHIEKKLGAVVILPLYLYDHSGITMNTTGFSCPWDSGQIGFTFCTKEQIRENFMQHRVTRKKLEHARKLLLGEVETYDMYIRGEVYGYTVKDAKGEEIDACGGFFGSDHEKSGLYESAGYPRKKEEVA